MQASNINQLLIFGKNFISLKPLEGGLACRLKMVESGKTMVSSKAMVFSDNAISCIIDQDLRVQLAKESLPEAEIPLIKRKKLSITLLLNNNEVKLSYFKTKGEPYFQLTSQFTIHQSDITVLSASTSEEGTSFDLEVSPS